MQRSGTKNKYGCRARDRFHKFHLSSMFWRPTLHHFVCIVSCAIAGDEGNVYFEFQYCRNHISAPKWTGLLKWENSSPPSKRIFSWPPYSNSVYFIVSPSFAFPHPKMKFIEKGRRKCILLFISTLSLCVPTVCPLPCVCTVCVVQLTSVHNFHSNKSTIFPIFFSKKCTHFLASSLFIHIYLASSPAVFLTACEWEKSDVSRILKLHTHICGSLFSPFVRQHFALPFLLLFPHMIPDACSTVFSLRK